MRTLCLSQCCLLSQRCSVSLTASESTTTLEISTALAVRHRLTHRHRQFILYATKVSPNSKYRRPEKESAFRFAFNAFTRAITDTPAKETATSTLAPSPIDRQLIVLSTSHLKLFHDHEYAVLVRPHLRHPTVAKPAHKLYSGTRK